ncbi:MAG: UvrD-helicase domain-containing protein [Endomicrobiia bacterium]
MEQFLSQLNAQQLAAVKYIEGPMVVFAGAGTGKTRVITYRIAYLLSIGVNPYNILGVTFTNKAAEEMKQRVIELVPDKGRYVWISTFHSLCASILYLEKESLGIYKNFVIYDETDSINLIKEILSEISLENKKISPYDIYEKICRAKDNLIDATSYKIHAEVKKDPVKEIVSEVYIRYQNKLEKNHAFDFGDLLIKVIEAFKDPKYASVKEKYTDRFKFIHVDEYQDVNHAQVVLLKILSSKHKNVCVVGDDDQAIYSWRGSDVRYLLNFSKEFATDNIPVKKFKLEKNYRSKQSILDIGNTLISHNKDRYKKVLFSDIKGNIKEDIIIRQFKNEYEEAKFVAKSIASFKDDKNSIAVLYRTNTQSRVFEEVFMEFNIPYKIVGSVGFYERKEIKDIIAYLKILVNPYDEISLKRIINIPPRGIGEVTILYLSTLSKENKISLWEQILKIDETELSLKVKNSIWKFLTLYDILKKCKETMMPSEFLKFLIEKTGYIDFIEENYKYQEKIEKIKNLQELISVAKEYEKKDDISTIEEFLNKISLFSSSDLVDSENFVYLMTLHIAKGLEFDVVFLVGLEEGILPIYYVLGRNQFIHKFPSELYDEDSTVFSASSINEERRLCYVGITRAKNKLYLTYSLKRKIYGIERELMPSRFLDEILLEYNKTLEKPQQKEPFIDKIDLKEINSFNVLRVGEYVVHEKFGIGKVTDILREPFDNKIVVLFQDGKERKLSLNYAKLKKL